MAYGGPRRLSKGDRAKGDQPIRPRRAVKAVGRYACAVAAAVVVGAPLARAQAPLAGWTPAVQAGLASDYLFRGVDQTRGRSEAFAGAEADDASARVGVWVSNTVVPGADGATTQAEVDLYGGWLTSVEGFDVELGAIGYLFTGARARPDLAELYGKLGRTIGPVRLGVAANYGPGGERGARDGYAELNADYPLTPKWSVSGAVGHLYEDRAEVLDPFAPPSALGAVNATTWSAATRYDLTDRITLELQWSDLDHSGAAYPSRLFATVRAKLF